MLKVRRSSLSLVALCLLALVGSLALVWAVPSHALAQEDKSFHFQEYNTDIRVNRDGSMDVAETLTYSFDRGSFSRGNAAIPLDRVERITDVRVAEIVNGQAQEYQQSSSGQRGTFTSYTSGDDLLIDWVYGPTANTTRTFRISYHVTGGIRVYDDRDELQWFAIAQDTEYIERGRVTVTLPEGVDVSSLGVASEPAAEVSRQGNTVTWTASGLNNGLEVGVVIPKGVLQVSKPAWQDRVDEEERLAQERAERAAQLAPIISFAMLALGGLILVLGVLFAIVRWQKWGRDKPVKLHSDYVTEPPSDLPPGLVGTLLDESADVRDVIATVVDQGRKGNLMIREAERGGIFAAKDFEYQQLNRNVQYRFEEMVLNAFFKHGNPVRLSNLKNTFYQDLQPIYEEMYRSLVGLKYFPDNPKAVRGRNSALGIALLVLGGLFFFVGAPFFEGMDIPTLICPALALGAVGLVWMVLAGAMPRKTEFGSEEAEKWRAFKRYLEQMQKYTDVQAAADKFQQYLPYAVALGVERQLTRQFESVPAAMPPYYAPYGWYPMPRHVGTGVGGGHVSSGPDSIGGGGGMPQFDPGGAMQGMSDSFAGAMQGMSDSFTSMVNSASNVLTSRPQSSSSSSGGWGGGGGSFGGGGGGGGSRGAS